MGRLLARLFSAKSLGKSWQVSPRVLPRVSPRVSERVSARLLARLFASKSLAKSLGSDPMHDSRRDSLRDSFFYAGSSLRWSFFHPAVDGMGFSAFLFPSLVFTLESSLKLLSLSEWPDDFGWSFFSGRNFALPDQKKVSREFRHNSIVNLDYKLIKKMGDKVMR